MKSSNNSNESPIAGTIINLAKDPVIKTIMIVGGCLAVLYIAGFAFKIASGTIREYKGLNAAIRL